MMNGTRACRNNHRTCTKAYESANEKFVFGSPPLISDFRFGTRCAHEVLEETGAKNTTSCPIRAETDSSGKRTGTETSDAGNTGSKSPIDFFIDHSRSQSNRSGEDEIECVDGNDQEQNAEKMQRYSLNGVMLRQNGFQYSAPNKQSFANEGNKFFPSTQSQQAINNRPNEVDLFHAMNQLQTLSLTESQRVQTNRVQKPTHVSNDNFNNQKETAWTISAREKAALRANNGHVVRSNGHAASHVDAGLKYLEQAGMKMQTTSQKTSMFKKRKDLRALKQVLSADRFREVALKFGDGGDDGAREILEAVHRSMKSANQSTAACLFCDNTSQVFENFPLVDGTLFLTPVKLSPRCHVAYHDPMSVTRGMYMCFVCVRCLDGQPGPLKCAACRAYWNGGAYQIGTLYAYNIIAATPCCSSSVSCKHCDKPLIDLSRGDQGQLFFSHFSKKTKCPHCHLEDFHYVKRLPEVEAAP